MSLSQRDISILVNVARGLCLDLQVPVAITDTDTHLPVFADLKNTKTAVASTAVLAVIVNRYFVENEGAGKPPAIPAT